MTPSVDSRAKHSKVVKQLIQDLSPSRTKKERFRKKNTILKAAGGFAKGNSKNRNSLLFGN